MAKAKAQPQILVVASGGQWDCRYMSEQTVSNDAVAYLVGMCVSAHFGRMGSGKKPIGYGTLTADDMHFYLDFAVDHMGQIGNSCSHKELGAVLTLVMGTKHSDPAEFIRSVAYLDEGDGDFSDVEGNVIDHISPAVREKVIKLTMPTIAKHVQAELNRRRKAGEDTSPHAVKRKPDVMDRADVQAAVKVLQKFAPGTLSPAMLVTAKTTKGRPKMRIGVTYHDED